MAARQNEKYLISQFPSGPFDKATIELSTRYYVRPRCTNIDPSQELELRHALVAASEELFSKVDDFIEQESGKRHLLILADSGTGKTSFLLNYYAVNSRKKKRKRRRMALIPLGTPDADALIGNVPNPSETVLLLDAFDEDTKARPNHKERIESLLALCRSFNRVIITCRTQFFPKDEEIPVKTGIARFGPRKAGEKGEYDFWKLYLAPFSDTDVAQYLKRRYKPWQFGQRRKATQVVQKCPLLSVRPMLLAHIPDIVKEDIAVRSASEIYKIMIDSWLERESFRDNKGALLDFSKYLAVNIYLNREKRGRETLPLEELPDFLDSWREKLQRWQVTGRSLLNRDAEGNYKFAHRSIMEFLFAKSLIEGRVACDSIPLTDLMKKFLIEELFSDCEKSLGVEFPERFYWTAEGLISKLDVRDDNDVIEIPEPLLLLFVDHSLGGPRITGKEISTIIPFVRWIASASLRLHEDAEAPGQFIFSVRPGFPDSKVKFSKKLKQRIRVKLFSSSTESNWYEVVKGTKWYVNCIEEPGSIPFLENFRHY